MGVGLLHPIHSPTEGIRMPSTLSRLFSTATQLAWGTLILLLTLSLHAAQPDGDKKATKDDDKKATKDGEVRKPETPKHKERYALEYSHSFKGDKEKPAEFRLHGAEPGECVDF